MTGERKRQPFSRVAHRAARLFAGVGTAGLLILAFGTVADVLLRYGFARPIRGYGDVAALASAVLLAALMPYVVSSRGNVAVEFVGSALGSRVHGWLDRFGAILATVFFGLMAWQYFLYTANLFKGRELMSVLRWPVWPWWAVVTALISLTALVALFTINDEQRRGDEGAAE